MKNLQQSQLIELGFRLMVKSDYDVYAGAEPGCYIQSTEKFDMIYNSVTGEMNIINAEIDVAFQTINVLGFNN